MEPNSVDSGHDEIGPVEIDELTATHYAKMNKRVDMSGNIDASTNRTTAAHTDEDSQECVGIGTIVVCVGCWMC